MLLHRAAHPLHLILQLPLRAIERVMQSELEILEALVLMRRAVDSHLALPGQAQKNLDLVRIADMPMAARRLDRHAAGRDAAEPLLRDATAKSLFCCGTRAKPPCPGTQCGVRFPCASFRCGERRVHPRRRVTFMAPRRNIVHSGPAATPTQLKQRAGVLEPTRT